MDFLSNMNRALDYIETHLTEDIDYSDLARAAHCSACNFQRFFTYVSGVSLSEYIRRRRLSCAALELQTSNVKVIDLAVKYGYESSVSFSRAFQSLHGITPTEARKGQILKAYPRMVFDFAIRGGTSVDYQILSKSAFRMIGLKETISKIDDQNLSRIPALWKARGKERKELAELSNEPDRFVYGVTMNYAESSFDYCIAAISNRPVTGDRIEIKVPEMTWAIFQCVGPLPDAQYDLWRKIFLEWLPISGYSLIEAPEIEWYSEGDINSQDYVSEIWLPIQKSS